MTQYRIKIVNLFDPDTSVDGKNNNDEYNFTKEYYLPQKYIEPLRYDWWVKLFGKKDGWWVSCSPNKECPGRIDQSYEGNGIDYFEDRQQCHAWIEQLKLFYDQGKIIEYEYIDQKMNSFEHL